MRAPTSPYPGPCRFQFKNHLPGTLALTAHLFRVLSWPILATMNCRVVWASLPPSVKGFLVNDSACRLCSLSSSLTKDHWDPNTRRWTCFRPTSQQIIWTSSGRASPQFHRSQGISSHSEHPPGRPRTLQLCHANWRVSCLSEKLILNVFWFIWGALLWGSVSLSTQNTP